MSAGPLGRPARVPPSPRPPPPGTCFSELDGNTLHVYGESMEFLERQWPQTVTALAFHFVLFDSLAPNFPRMRSRFPALVSLTFADTHVHCLSQIGLLAVVKKLEVVLCERGSHAQHLSIIESQPLLLNLKIWRPYVIHRLQNLPLKVDPDVC